MGAFPSKPSRIRVSGGNPVTKPTRIKVSSGTRGKLANTSSRTGLSKRGVTSRGGLSGIRAQQSADIARHGVCNAKGPGKSGSRCIRAKGHVGGHASKGNAWS